MFLTGLLWVCVGQCFVCVRSCVAGDAYLVIVSGLLRPVCVGHCVCSSFVLSAVDCCCFRIVPVCMHGMFNSGCNVFTFGIVVSSVSCVWFRLFCMLLKSMFFCFSSRFMFLSLFFPF